MNRHHTHADWTLLPRGYFLKRADVQLFAEIELASSSINNILDDPAFMLVLLSVLFLALLVAIPNALAGRALLDGIALLSARRTHLGRGLGITLLVGVLISVSFIFRSFRG